MAGPHSGEASPLLVLLVSERELFTQIPSSALILDQRTWQLGVSLVATLHFTDKTDVPVSTVFRFLIKPVSGVLHVPNNPQYFGVVSWPLFVTFLENLFLFMFMIWALIQDIEMVDCSQDL